MIRTFSTFNSVLSSINLIPKIDLSRREIIDISGLYIYYTFDLPTIKDSSLNGIKDVANLASGALVYDANIATGYISSSNPNPKYGDGILNIIGDSKYLTITKTFDLGNTGGTFAFWFRSNNSGLYARLFTFSQMNVYIGGNSLTIEAPGNTRFSVPFNINDNSLHHFVWTYSYNSDGSSNSLVYVDNVLYLTKKYNNYVIIGNNNSIGFGTGQSGYPHPKISIDDFRYYTRVISVNEINSLYNGL